MAEGEGVVIPVEARDELSSAFTRMSEAAKMFQDQLDGVNDKMKELGSNSDDQEKRSEDGGFFGKLSEGYDAINSFKVGDLMHEFEDTSVAGLAVGASMFEGAKAAMDLQKQIVELGFASAVSKKDINELTRASYSMAEGSIFSADKFQYVGSRMLKYGATMEDTKAAMESTGQMTAAFGGDFENNYFKAEQATKAFGMEVSKIPEVMNTVAKVASNTNLSMDELLSPMQRMAPLAKGVGLTFNDTAGIMAAFNKAGLGGRFAMFALMESMEQATKRGVDYKTYMKSVGDDYKKLNSETARSSLLMSALGERGAMLSEVFKQTGGDISQMTSQFSGSSTTLLSDYEKMMSMTASDKLELFKNHWENASSEVATKYLPAFGGLLTLMNKIPPEAIFMGTATAQGFGVMAKSIDIAYKAAEAFKLLNMAGMFSSLVTAIGPMGIALASAAGLFAVTVAGGAALGIALGMLINKFMETNKYFKDFIDYTIMLPMTLAELGQDFMNKRAGDNASSYNNITDAGSTLQKTGAFDKKSAYSVIRVETATNTKEREVLERLVEMVGQSGVHVDKVEFNVTKDTKAEDVEKMLRELLLRGRSNTPAAGPLMATR